MSTLWDLIMQIGAISVIIIICFNENLTEED